LGSQCWCPYKPPPQRNSGPGSCRGQEPTGRRPPLSRNPESGPPPAFLPVSFSPKAFETEDPSGVAFHTDGHAVPDLGGVRDKERLLAWRGVVNSPSDATGHSHGMWLRPPLGPSIKRRKGDETNTGRDGLGTDTAPPWSSVRFEALEVGITWGRRFRRKGATGQRGRFTPKRWHGDGGWRQNPPHSQTRSAGRRPGVRRSVGRSVGRSVRGGEGAEGHSSMRSSSSPSFVSNTTSYSWSPPGPLWSHHRKPETWTQMDPPPPPNNPPPERGMGNGCR